MTKYARQIASARKSITKKGTLVTWFKAANTNTGDDTSPEFPTEDPPTTFVVPCVFYPSTSAKLVTNAGVAEIGGFTDRLQGIIPGDCGFIPVQDDAVLVVNGDGSMQTIHVDTVNVTAPDLTPILYEIVFK